MYNRYLTHDDDDFRSSFSPAKSPPPSGTGTLQENGILSFLTKKLNRIDKEDLLLAMILLLLYTESKEEELLFALLLFFLL